MQADPHPLQHNLDVIAQQGGHVVSVPFIPATKQDSGS